MGISHLVLFEMTLAYPKQSKYFFNIFLSLFARYSFSPAESARNCAESARNCARRRDLIHTVRYIHLALAEVRETRSRARYPHLARDFNPWLGLTISSWDTCRWRPIRMKNGYGSIGLTSFVSPSPQGMVISNWHLNLLTGWHII